MLYFLSPVSLFNSSCFIYYGDGLAPGSCDSEPLATPILLCIKLYNIADTELEHLEAVHMPGLVLFRNNSISKDVELLGEVDNAHQNSPVVLHDEAPSGVNAKLNRQAAPLHPIAVEKEVVGGEHGDKAFCFCVEQVITNEIGRVFVKSVARLNLVLGQVALHEISALV